MSYTLQEIAKMIDHALLKPTLTTADLEQGIQTALDYDVASVCILPYYLRRCAQILKGSSVKAGTTIGFPHGAQSVSSKLAEADQAVHDGADEVDMVINISQVLSDDWNFVRNEIHALTDVIHTAGKKLKVIFETCYLNDDQKIRLCEICSYLKVDWVKTSTGYGIHGATIEDVKLMRQHLPAQVQVKAAGGIHDLETLLAFRAAGATRIGTSHTAKILEECKRRLT